jgi:hypothetical protein
MITPTPTSRRAAPSLPVSAGVIPADSLPSVFMAFNACRLASGYLERGNFPAARRQLVQALAAVNEAQGGTQ